MSTQFLSLPGGKIAYEETGSGPLVICAPSLGDLRGEYRFLAPILVSAGFRAVCMDLRGLGESSTGWNDYSAAAVGGDILALIQQLGSEPAVIIGDSMAGGAAAWAAAQQPNAVRGLILLDPFVRGETNAVSRLLYSLLFSRPWGMAAWGMYYASLYPSRKPDDFAAYRETLRANLAEPGRMEALQQMLVASKTAVEKRLSEVKSPALVLMGSQDPDFKDPQREAAMVAQLLRGTYQMIRGAGHYPHAEFPAETAAYILPFLQSLAA
jgi:pimeloyl-ACP methyl ester carboxylesterase